MWRKGELSYGYIASGLWSGLAGNFGSPYVEVVDEHGPSQIDNILVDKKRTLAKLPDVLLLEDNGLHGRIAELLYIADFPNAPVEESLATRMSSCLNLRDKE